MSKAEAAADRIASAMGWDPEDVTTDGQGRVSLTAAQVDALMEWVEPARRRAEVPGKPEWMTQAQWEAVS